MATTNGISDESAAIQSAHTDARTARDAFEVVESDAQAMVGEFDAALDHLRQIATALQPLLTSRRYAYWRAVGAERARAKLTGTESTEDQIVIKPFRRDGRRGLPAGVLLDMALWSETSLVLPSDPDPAESLVVRPDYLNTGATPVPLRRNKP